VICLTASVAADEVAELRAAGAVACITKDQELSLLVLAVCEAAGS
jgi:hypothetical protein